MQKRTLSFWGWGYADRFPDRADRRKLLEDAAALLETDRLELREPPTLDSIDLPEPRVTPTSTLETVLSVSRRDRASHTFGKGYRDLVRGFHGAFDPAPDVVARPGNERDVRDVLSWADRRNLAVVPFGGGTSVVGGVEASFDREEYSGVVSLDTRGMGRVLDVDARSGMALVQAGATGPALEEQLEAHGRTMRHYPQSYEFSTLGGWIATRSSGHYATVETRVDDLVRSVRMVTPSGPLESEAVPASGAGPDPDALICGSEGILGVITRASVRVRRPPGYRSRASVVFDDFDAAVGATRTLAQSRLFPVNCRLLDENEVVLNRITERGGHVLLLGFESEHGSTEPDMRRAVELARDHGGEVLDEPSHRTPDTERSSEGADTRWRQSFFEAPYLFNALVSMGVLVDTFETACTWKAFPEMHRAIRRDVQEALEEVCGGGFLSTRFTHVYPEGPAPYYTFAAPARVGSELSQWREIKGAASEALRRHGGTITHHHAVGRLHRPWYEDEAPGLYRESLGAVKERLDPHGLMNPGVLLNRGDAPGRHSSSCEASNSST